MRLGIGLYLELAMNLPRIAPFVDLMFSAIGSCEGQGNCLFSLFFLVTLKKISFMQKKGVAGIGV